MMNETENPIKQNQTPRIYEETNGFEMRTGKFYDPNEKLNGIKFEIRILSKDPELIEILRSKIKEIIS